ncbi:Protein of unknown function [Gryllus bimaculatus]|nr:Protein of unknown function [Gryllus bimaculatus]
MKSVDLEAAQLSLLSQLYEKPFARQWHLVNTNASILKHFDTVTLALEAGDAVLSDKGLTMAKMMNEQPEVAVMVAVGDGGGNNGCGDGEESTIGSAPRMPTEHELFMLIVRSPEDIFRFFDRHQSYHPRAAILVLIVCDYDSTDRQTDPEIYRSQLHILWVFKRILNIFIVDECSTTGSLLSYDPFSPSGNGSEGGRIYNISAQEMQETDPYLMRDVHDYPNTMSL